MPLFINVPLRPYHVKLSSVNRLYRQPIIPPSPYLTSFSSHLTFPAFSWTRNEIRMMERALVHLSNNKTVSQPSAPCTSSRTERVQWQSCRIYAGYLKGVFPRSKIAWIPNPSRIIQRALIADKTPGLADKGSNSSCKAPPLSPSLQIACIFKIMKQGTFHTLRLVVTFLFAQKVIYCSWIC